MALEGMDPETVQNIVTQIGTAHNDITSAINAVNGALGNASWIGNDRMHFESEWNSVMGILNNAVNQLGTLSSYATTKIAEQNTASNA